MKHTLFLLSFCYISFISAQDSTKTKVETPKIITKLMYGNTINIEGLDFKFVGTQSDSRCPKGVQCVWAGEVIATVNILKEGTVLERKRIVFSATSKAENLTGNIFSSEAFNVSGLSVGPYPEYRDKIKKEDYYINLEIRN